MTKFSANKFLSLLEKRFNVICKRPPKDPYSISDYGQEKYLQIEVADILQEEGFRVFTEYPFKYSNESHETCDIAITTNKNCWDYNTIIEIKPMLEGYTYWSCSKFFNDKYGYPFHKDILKLASEKSLTADKWFLLFMFSHKSLDFCSTKNIMKGHLNPGDVSKVISYWSGLEPFGKKVIEINSEEKSFLYILLWKITKCLPDPRIKKLNGCYKILWNKP